MCSKSPVTTQGTNDIIIAETYTIGGYNGQIRSLKISAVNDEPIQDEDFQIINEKMNLPTIGKLVDPRDNTHFYLYETETELNLILKDFKKSLPAPQNLSKEKMLANMILYEHPNFLGRPINMTLYGNIVDMNEVGLENTISSLKIYGDQNVFLTLYEHANYGGKSLSFWNDAGFSSIINGVIYPQFKTINVANLSDYCMNRFIFCRQTWDNQPSSAKVSFNVTF
jgi:hypothetical protein